MAKYNERSSVTGRFTPKATVDEVLEQTMPVDHWEPDGPGFRAPGLYYRNGAARHTGRADTDSAYLPGEYRNPLTKYQHGPQDTRAAQTLFEGANPAFARARKAILIDAQTGERLDERIVQVEQPENVMDRPDVRLMSRKTFGHLDEEG